jgi:hypothetical protein
MQEVCRAACKKRDLAAPIFRTDTAPHRCMPMCHSRGRVIHYLLHSHLGYHLCMKIKYHRPIRDPGRTRPSSGHSEVLERAVSIQRDAFRRFLVLTLRVDCLPLLGVGRIGIVAIGRHLSVLLRVDHASRLLRRILALVLSLAALVADRWQRRSATILLIAWLLYMLRIRLLSFNLLSLLGCSGALAFLILLPNLLFLLLAGLPLLADLFEFCTC